MGEIRQIQRERDKNQPAKCANCFVCKQDTELCPLNENYDPDGYLKWEAKYLERRREKNKD